MRATYIIALTLVGYTLPLGAYGLDGTPIQRRQDTADGSFPTLTTSQSPSETTTLPPHSTASTAIPKSSDQVESATSHDKTIFSQAATTSPSKVTTTNLPTTSAVDSHSTATAMASMDKHQDELPLKPEITPAFGTAGALLIILGTIHALVGVKSRWVQIFLSSGFLASIATAALFTYVMDPPVRAAIQGGYFVAIVMTGVIFGAGALIFKEFTEGFGCLLGGFCLSMWLLTLRSGGLVRGSGAKGVFIGALCLGAWALSWTHYTRPYGLIASTSFAGATAFMLGIDCFARAGMKEFWVYIWDLNDDLFPLNTSTYPLTRGIRVEIAIVVIGTIIGLLSQIKLWKVIRSSQKERELLDREAQVQKDAVEAELDRHLQRQNEREKLEWERHYGDRRDAHPKRLYSHVSVVAVPQGPPSSPEALEMDVFKSRRSSSLHTSRSIRQGSVIVDAIEEVDEVSSQAALDERQKALEALEESEARSERTETGEQRANSMDGADTHNGIVENEIEGSPRSKRLSLSGLTKRLSPSKASVSESREHLLAAERPLSRASSAAATLDIENEELDPSMLGGDPEDDACSPWTTPDIVVSPATPSRYVALGSSSKQSDGVIKEDAAPSSSSSEKYEGGPPVQRPPSVTITVDSAGEGEIANSQSKSKTDPIEGEKGQPSSQASDGANSSHESLTKTALAQVPSQLSNVVLSYRTNEWAKHIAIAEMPIYDEPQTMSDDGEAVAQLAPYVAEAEQAPVSKDPSIKLSTAQMPVPVVKTSGAGVGIAYNAGGKRRSLYDQERRRSGAQAASRSGSIQTLRVAGNRSGRNSLMPELTTSLITTPIYENTPTEFPHPRLNNRHASGSSSSVTASQRRSSAPVLSAGGVRHYLPNGGASPIADSIQDSSQSSRAASHQTYMPADGTGIGVDPSVPQQPHRPDGRSDLDRRQSLLAEWRLLQQHRAMSKGLSGASGEEGRARMRAEKENRKLMEEYQRAAKREKQYAIDQAMRRPDMQELHREAMRRMQASANNRLRSSSG